MVQPDKGIYAVLDVVCPSGALLDIRLGSEILYVAVEYKLD